MKPIIAVITVCLFFLTLPNAAGAQIAKVKKGDIIRISAPALSDSLITGQVDSITAAAIRLVPTPAGAWQSEIPLASIARLELRKAVRRTGRGAVVGAGIGAFTLGMIAMASNQPCNSDEWCLLEFSSAEAFLLGAAGGAVSGALIGAVIGNTQKRMTWKEIPLEVSGATIAIPGYQGRYITGVRLRWSF